MTGKFPAQRASNTETFSIWWRHHESLILWLVLFGALPASLLYKWSLVNVWTSEILFGPPLVKQTESNFWYVKCINFSLSSDIDSLLLSAAYMSRWTWSSLVQIMAYHLFEAKPLTKPMTAKWIDFNGTFIEINRLPFTKWRLSLSFTILSPFFSGEMS